MNTEKPEPVRQPSMLRYYVFLGVIFVISIAAAFANTTLGAASAFDRKSEEDISVLTTRINSYQQRYNELPKTLTEAVGTNPHTSRPINSYEYKTTGQYTYQICTTFKTSTLASGVSSRPYAPAEQVHSKGHVCLDLRDEVAVPAATPRSTPPPVPDTQAAEGSCTIQAGCADAKTNLRISSLYGTHTQLGVRNQTGKNELLTWDTQHQPVIKTAAGSALKYTDLKIGSSIDVTYSGYANYPVGQIIVR